MSSTARIAATGSLARLRLCMVMHVARVEGLARGRACGAASQDWGIGPPRSTGVRKGSFTGQERTHGGIGPSLPQDVPPYLGLEGISESFGGPLSSWMPCNSANPFCATSHVLSATATRCWMDLNS
jgi:hypothetical protein